MFENYIPPALFVTWQDPVARSIYPVGRLVRTAGASPAYEFAYLIAAREAEERGFTPFPAFPKLEEVYRSRELPPFFENRLMPQARPEFRAHLVELGLDGSPTPQSILARSNGRRATDAYEVFSEFEPTTSSGEYETWFFARSLRYLAHPEALDKLTPDEKLFVMRDVQNDVDPHALALRTAGNALGGFCPAYLAEDLGPLLSDPTAVQIVVGRLNPPPTPLQHRLQCRLRVRPQQGFHCYRSGRYEPISADALRLANWQPPGAVA